MAFIQLYLIAFFLYKWASFFICQCVINIIFIAFSLCAFISNLTAIIFSLPFDIFSQVFSFILTCWKQKANSIKIGYFSCPSSTYSNHSCLHTWNPNERIMKPLPSLFFESKRSWNKKSFKAKFTGFPYDFICEN